MKIENQNDNLLWVQFREGDKQAFASIYHAHIDSLISYGGKLCTDREILKDNIQDMFVELWNSRENLANPDCVKFYLFKALRYKLIRAEKVRKLHVVVSPNGEAIYNGIDNSIEARIIEKEIRDSQAECLRNAIAALTKRQQEAIQLRFYQGFTNEQIASLMEMNYQSVSNLVHTALYRIKNNLRSTAVFATTLISALHLFI
jgi:RNA polymerase sigma factor (sigma-70 family)